MSGKMLNGIVAATVVLVIACAAGIVLLSGAGAASGCTTPQPSGSVPQPSGSVAVSAPARGWPRVDRFDPERLGRISIIAAAGTAPPKPDTALRAKPVISRSNRATSIYIEQCSSICPTTFNTASVDPSTTASATVSCEWTAPVQAPVVSGFRTPNRPAHDGIDLGATRGTPIRAASAGVVVVVRCNVVPASHGCDQDGSPSTPGCGWYLDLRHTNEIYTRYCHMRARPAVVEGQTVVAGQVLGVVGSSGHSSGPHLHFEVHVRTRGEGAVDPVTFMAARGVHLDQPTA